MCQAVDTTIPSPTARNDPVLAAAPTGAGAGSGNHHDTPTGPVRVRRVRRPDPGRRHTILPTAPDAASTPPRTHRCRKDPHMHHHLGTTLDTLVSTTGIGPQTVSLCAAFVL